MLTLSPRVRIYVARDATDMRKSIDGLEALTRVVLRHDAFSGDLFVFCNRRRNRIKILYWESSGFWLLHKRLEKGTFAWPAIDDPAQTHVEMDQGALAALLAGLDFSAATTRRWYRRKAVNRSAEGADHA